MRSSLAAVLSCVALSLVGCAGAGGEASPLEPKVSGVQPPGGYTLATTDVLIQGALPVKPAASMSGSSSVEATYRAWFEGA